MKNNGLLIASFFLLNYILSITLILSGECLYTREERYNVAYILISRDSETVRSTLDDKREISQEYLLGLAVKGSSWMEFPELLGSC